MAKRSNGHSRRRDVFRSNLVEINCVMKEPILYTFLAAESVLFWALALPVAMLAFPALTIAEKIGETMHRRA